MAIVVLVRCSPTCSGIPADDDDTVQKLAGFQQTQKCLFPNLRWESHFCNSQSLRIKAFLHILSHLIFVGSLGDNHLTKGFFLRSLGQVQAKFQPQLVSRTKALRRPA